MREKTSQDLSKLLAQTREKVRGLRFSVSAKQLKNIRESREAKRLVARILTLQKEQVKYLNLSKNGESSPVSKDKTSQEL